MSREETKSKLVELIEPLLLKMEFELLDLEYFPGRQGKVLLIIDSEDGVSIEDCEKISRAVSGLLDLHDPLPHAYVLEVASPGLERPLTKPVHFIRFIGEPVKVVLNQEIDGSLKIAGYLVEADLKQFRIEKDDGSRVAVSFNKVKRARLWYRKPQNVKKKSK